MCIEVYLLIYKCEWVRDENENVSLYVHLYYRTNMLKSPKNQYKKKFTHWSADMQIYTWI